MIYPLKMVVFHSYVSLPEGLPEGKNFVFFWHNKLQMGKLMVLLHCRVHPFQRSPAMSVPLVAQHAVPGSRQTWRGTLGQPPVQAIIDLSNVANVVKPCKANNKLINHLIGQELFHGDS